MVASSVAEGRADIDLSAQPDGLYMVRIMLNGVQQTQKLWKH
jgi:hypothetical protein